MVVTEMKFHEKHCPGVQILRGGSEAKWIPEQGKFGWAFSNKSIPYGEKVSFKVMESSVLSDSTPSAAKMGFFTFIEQDPDTLSVKQLAGIDAIVKYETEVNDKLSVLLAKGQVYTCWVDDNHNMIISQKGVGNDPPLQIKSDHKEFAGFQQYWLMMKTGGNIQIQFTDGNE